MPVVLVIYRHQPRRIGGVLVSVRCRFAFWSVSCLTRGDPPPQRPSAERSSWAHVACCCVGQAKALLVQVTRRYYICFVLELHYVIVLCGAERVRTITISTQNLQSLCFDGVRLTNAEKFSRDLEEARSPALARLPHRPQLRPRATEASQFSAPHLRMKLRSLPSCLPSPRLSS